MNAPIYAFSIKTSDGQTVDLSEFQGRVLLIVNTASQCGFTPQYAGLEQLYQNYREQGLVILGFPCNQFGHQEPGNDEEIQAFCRNNYGVSFPLSEKIDVRGENAHPLFQYLTHAKPGALGSEGIKWNFTKFLVNRQGEVVARYAPMTKPESLAQEIQKWLGSVAGGVN